MEASNNIRKVDNFINGEFVAPSSGQYLDVTAPQSGEVCARVALSGPDDVEQAVKAAEEAFKGWSALTSKSRAGKMLAWHRLIAESSEELSQLISLENGKTLQEALASVAKGNETVEWSSNLPHAIRGHCLQVSRGVTCQDERRPIGVVSCIVPFNFPAMVPLWTTPIALVAGNCVIIKPSEKCPLTLCKIIGDLAVKAGIPPGVLQMVNGQRDAVESLIDHPGINAVTFVGSSHVAEIVHKRASSLCKRVLALGGAKNHLVALKDCDVDMTSSDVVSSFAGCAGQRCMAASVLLLVGENQQLLDDIVTKAGNLLPGIGKGCMGPVIDEASKKKVIDFIEMSEKSGATILLDGRKESWIGKKGSWVGPTVILHSNPSDRALHEEIFGPVLSILKVKNEEEAIRIENASQYGNAACIYTSNGGKAEWFCGKFKAGMLGVNIGIPVPREPFSFGGLYGTKSMFGYGDVTGEGAMELFTTKIKVTTKWAKFHTNDISQFK